MKKFNWKKPVLKKKKQPAKARAKSIDGIIKSRVRWFALAIALVFGAIFVRLVYVQAFSYEEYKEKTEDYTSIRQYTSAPRGQIFDSKGNVLAKTVVSHNIVYTSPAGMSTDDYLSDAERLATVFDINLDDFSFHDKQEAFLTSLNLLDYDDPKHGGIYLLDEEEKKQYESGAWGENADSRLYAAVMSHIGQDEINSLKQADLKKYLIYSRMTAYLASGQENVILEDVSNEDVAYLVEHKTEFPGFDIDFGGWKREYPYGEMLSDVLGSVSNTTQGLPEEYAEEYMAQGYQYNASVGTSGLELKYNDLLAGTQEVAKITYDSQGLAQKEVIQEAKKGYDIVLSIDAELQQTVDQTVHDTLENLGGTGLRENFSSLFFCMMDPNTGEVRALSGYQKDLDTGKMTYFASGNYLSLANPGSVVKGATVYMGLSEGVVKPGEYIYDAPMNIGGQEFASFNNWGPVDAVSALAVSSNVYMFNVAMRMAGQEYSPGAAFNVKDLQGSFNKMRHYYSLFGLGNPTGLDVPYETDGYTSNIDKPGMLLNYSIGQFDMYSPIQLLQYVSTIAADGTVMQPHFYKYAKEVNSDQIVDVNEQVVRNVLNPDNQKYLDVVQEGFRACVANGNCGTDLQASGVAIAAKTGTAEVEEWTTANQVGYAPYDNPTIAYACVAPTSSVNSKDVAENVCYTYVAPPILEKYFQLYPDASGNTMNLKEQQEAREKEEEARRQAQQVVVPDETEDDKDTEETTQGQ